MPASVIIRIFFEDLVTALRLDLVSELEDTITSYLELPLPT